MARCRHGDRRCSLAGCPFLSHGDGDEPIRIVSARPPPEMREERIKTEISKEQRNRLERLAAAPETDIDTSDIPEVRDWSGAVHGVSGQTTQEAVTVSLDADVLAWFEDHSEAGRNYQSEINRVLRRHVAAEQRRRA